MAPAILEVRRLTLSRGRRQIYENLSFTLQTGITALLGPNGAGKTTLLNGLLRPDRIRSGSVVLDGLAVSDRTALRAYHARLGHMPQDWRYFAGYSALESVEYVAWLKAVEDPRTAAIRALEGVDLADAIDTPVRRMSGGMRQRVGLAEALVNDPAIVLLDEPTVGLDPAQRASFRSALTAKADHRAVLLSTHLTDDVRAVANRVLVVDGGSVVFDGTPVELSMLAGSDSAEAAALEAGYLVAVSAPQARRG